MAGGHRLSVGELILRHKGLWYIISIPPQHCDHNQQCDENMIYLRHFQCIFLHKGIIPYFKHLCKIPIGDMDILAILYEISLESNEENWCCVLPLDYLLTNTSYCFHIWITSIKMSNITNHYGTCIALIMHTQFS